uniref:Putative secreted protein n=1 Tax=Anopheles triannulatus TaxID=58253 RepID=A0A2M4B429_9DIPT
MTAMMMRLLLLRMTITSDDVVRCTKTVSTIPKLFHAECGTATAATAPTTTNTPSARNIPCVTAGPLRALEEFITTRLVLEQYVVFTCSPFAD